MRPNDHRPEAAPTREETVPAPARGSEKGSGKSILGELLSLSPEDRASFLHILDEMIKREEREAKGAAPSPNVRDQRLAPMKPPGGVASPSPADRGCAKGAR